MEIADWWHASRMPTTMAREAMLIPDSGPKKSAGAAYAAQAGGEGGGRRMPSAGKPT
jgi:hypothetical protein